MVATKEDAFGIAGRTAVVTGGGSGIGRAIALALAGQGAAVAVLDRNTEGAQETLAAIVAGGGTGLALGCDVADPHDVGRAADAARARFGDAHILVNNAAMMRPGGLATLPLAEWNALLAVNLTGYFLCAQTFGHAMREGAIVHVSSVGAEQATPFAGAYSVAKAGVSMLSRLLAVEWGPEGVRSNVVCPGLIYTPLSQSAYERPGITERRAEAVPRRRIGRPEDIAEAVLFLCSQRADYINGAELVVDGGFTRNMMTLIPRAGYERSDAAPAA